MTEADVVVIGAGVIGLACAAELARRGRDVIVIERHEGPARETSARNSGVVHAGIYDAPGSLKARTCVEGRALLEARCARESIPYRRVGKLIVATDAREVPVLEDLLARGLENGAGALTLIDGDEVRRLEPRLVAVAALFSPASGIVDVHALASSYLREAARHGALLAWRTHVEALGPVGAGWSLRARGPDGATTITARAIVNAAGLEADRVAERAGLDVDALGWRLRFVKGDYFALSPRIGAPASRLVYPVPAHAGLGVHLTMDLGGAFRAGPDVEYVEAPRYDVREDKARAFADAVRRYFPALSDDDLTPDYAGVRPKLSGPDEAARDFVLEERPAGLVHLIGIESPGLTASEALARRVAELLG